MKRRTFLTALCLAPLAPKLAALSAPCEVPVTVDQTKKSTCFASLTPEQRKVWSRDLWNCARGESYVSRFHGSGANAIIQGI